MGPSALRSQLRTNIPGDTRISGCFNVNGATLTVLEGKRYVADRTGTGLYRVRFGNSTTELTPVLGLVACFANAVVAAPDATNSRWIVVQSIVTNADGTIAGVILGALDATGALANLTADDDICFECIVRDTAVTV